MSAPLDSFVAGWLVDTFVWTGALILAVLLLRRPVARWFGPQVAYALWALPLMRFLMPPVVLPASMAPAEPVAPAGDAMMMAAAPTAEAVAPSFAWVEPVLLALWLGGAAAFLAMRAMGYRRMRDSLLAETRSVGEAGDVRLVETPAVCAPVAFGVIDKVVALPPGFMAHYDRAARDLAIAHELAHHRGHDLLANIAAQPVLALHWFNPLAWWGWRAMRSDQEAACDARVMAGASRGQRAAYAEVIAGFARGNDFALAAPMACPVLGEKSIIHRLRSLTMTESSKTRRLAGIATIALGAFALPLTASVNYASPPEPPAAPLPPAPPAPPEAPLAPDAPEALLPVSFPDDLAVPTPPEALFLAADLDAVNAEVAAAIVEARAAEAEARAAEVEARAAEVEARAHAAEAMATAPRVEESCAGDEPVSELVTADGRRVVRICHEAIARQASRGLERARAAVASQRELSSDLREEILRDLDREIEGVRNPRRVTAVSSARGVRAVASARTDASASAGTVTPIAFVGMPGAVTATLRFVTAFAEQGEPQAISVTVPVRLVPTTQQPNSARVEKTV